MAKRDEMSFSRAFADARKELGAGKTFTWRGNSYTTDLAEEAPARGSRSPGRSVDEIARSASAAIDRAEERRPRMNPRRDTGMTESPRPQRRPVSQETATSVETRTRMTPEPINRNDGRSPARSMGTFNQDGTVQGEGQKARPGSLQRAIDSAPNATARSQADRIADQVRAGRMPLREALNKINEIFSNVPSLMAGRNEELRQTRAAAGMAKGGMVKKGNTDRRKTGMFYDSKSPRGFK